MKVIKLCADGVCSIKNIENTLEALQHEVGGYIKTITLASDLVLICDEEGRLKNKAPNLPASVFVPWLVGDVIVAGVSGDDFCDLSENMVRYVTKVLYRRLGWVLKEENNK